MRTPLKTMLFTLALFFSAWLAPLQADEKALLIDVRTPAEYQAGHIADASLIPFDQIGSQITTLTTDKSQPIALYCRSGRRADIALKTLQKMGYTNVKNLGGYEDLIKEGYPNAMD